MKKACLSGFLLVMLLGLEFWLAGRYAALVYQNAHASTVWARLEGEFQRRCDLTAFMEFVLGTEKVDKTLLVQVHKAVLDAVPLAVNAETLSPTEVGPFGLAEEKITKSLGAFFRASETAHPELRKDWVYIDFRRSLNALNANIAFDIDFYNTYIKDLNQRFQNWPDSWLVKVFTDYKPKALLDKNIIEQIP